MDTLPKTKFRPPLPHPNTISRASLNARLRDGILENKLMLVSAPAGYGKTTLLSALPEILPDMPMGWLSLDAEDNDPIRFLTGLAEAFTVIDPRLTEEIINQLSSAAGMVSGTILGVSLRQALVGLINAVFDKDILPFVLVMDDFHEIISPAICQAIDYLLEHMPPQMHLVIASRYEPALQIHRLRARRQIAELHLTDLQFDLDESQHFLNGQLRLGLSESDLISLQEKIEGWPVGLILLTNRLSALPPRRNRVDYLQNLRHIDSTTFHYLADEVLAQQPESLRTFLLETSILSELTPTGCRILTGREDAESLLAEIDQRNLFLTQVKEKSANEEAVYRYHALFAEFLQSELNKENLEVINQLHIKAAAVEKDPARNIQHLLAARQWNQAAEKIETVGEQFLERGIQGIVSGWVAALPVEYVQNRYRLLYIKGLSEFLKGDILEASRSLESSLRMLESGQDDAVRSKVLMHIAALSFVQAKFQNCAEKLALAEPYISDDRERIEFLMLRASLALFVDSNWKQAETDLREAVLRVEASDDLQSWYLFALNLAPEFSVLPGIIDVLEEFCVLAKENFGQQAAPLRLGVLDTQTILYLRRGKLIQAIQTGKDTLLVKEHLGGYPFLGINASLGVVLATSAVGNWTAADEALSRAEELVHESELNRALTGNLLYPLGRLRWLEGRLDEASQAYQQMGELENRLPLVDVLRRMLAGLIAISNKQYGRAENLLQESVSMQTGEWVSEIYGSARLLLSYLYTCWDRPRQAVAQMEILLARCETEGCSGLILQDMPLAAPALRLVVKSGSRSRQAESLLAQIGLSIDDNAGANTLLTVRQLDILRLIAAGYSNQAVADQLVLSLATVKSHVVHIMNRLGVSSRMEAVAKARQMGLL
jgi:LuxR family maltose regulon positive regulatory protein